jgi:hypothetical protein
MSNSARAISAAVAAVLALDCTFTVPAKAECYVQAPPRPVYRSYIRRDVVEPGVYDVARKPSLYGWVHQPYVHRRILLRPYKNIAHFQRPYIAFSREHLQIQPEGSRLVPAGSKPDC